MAEEDIACAWPTVVALRAPDDLAQALAQQQLACAAVLAMKSDLATALRTAAKAKDDEYVRLLALQTEVPEICMAC